MNQQQQLHHDLLGREVTDEPRRPEPVASPPSSRQHHRTEEELDEKEDHRHYHHHHHARRTSHNRDLHPSLSHTTEGMSAHTLDSIDLEKQALAGLAPSSRPRESLLSSDRHTGGDHGRSRGSRHERPMYRVGGGSDSSPRHQTIRHLDDADRSVLKSTTQAPQACQVLMHFLFLAPFLSLGLALWTLLISLVLLVIHPVRLIFTRQRSFAQVALSIHSSSINLQLRCIRSFPVAGAEMQLAETILVLVASSVLSFGLAIWSLVLAVYWLFALTIGDPDGLDGRSDGRELVMTTRRKWDDWLRLSVRPELRS